MTDADAGRTRARWETRREPWVEAQDPQPKPTKCHQPGCKRPPHRGPHRFLRRVDHADERTPRRIYGAVRPGTRLARSKRSYVDAVLDATEQCDPRFRASATAVAECLARRATWANGLPASFPGHQWLADYAGCSTKTVQRVLRFLDAHDLVARIAEGRSAKFRRDGGTKNEAAVYVLLVPAAAEQASIVDKSVHPREVPSLSKDPSAYARANRAERGTVWAAGVRRRSTVLLAVGGPGWRPRTHIGRAARKWQRELLAEQLIWRVPALKHATTKGLAAGLREHITPVEDGGAGWNLKDVLHALDWAPDGTRWRRPPLQEAHRPQRAAVARLAAWRDGEGRVLPSPTRRSSQGSGATA